MVKQSLLLIITLTLRVSFFFGQSGTLDGSFGNNGIVITDFNNRNDNLNAMEIQSDQKILAIGQTGAFSGIGADDFLVCRYNTDGTVDIDFGENGFARVIVSGDDFCWDSAIQPDGRIILAGTTVDFNDSTFQHEENFILIRLNNDGTRDSTFGISGVLKTDFGGVIDRLAKVIIQSDGKIIAAGEGFSDQMGSFYGMVRYESNGQLDTTFGHKGIQVIWDGFVVQALQLQADGKILLGGYSDLGPLSDFELRRFEADGAFDTAFGEGGMVHTDLSGKSDFVNGISIETDGKIFVSGGANFTGGTIDLAFARYHADGSLDNSYGNGGFEIIPLPPLSQVFDMARQPDGKYVLCGESNHLDGLTHFLLIRINHDGGLDNTFGDQGVVYTDIQAGPEWARALVIQDNNNIVLGGASQAPNLNFDFSLARYIVDDVVSTKDQNINELSFVISPNPCKDFILIHVEDGPDAFHCLIFDLLGHVVKDEILYSDIEDKLKVDTNLFIDGYYTISLDNGIKKGVASFVVDK